jgi:DNA-binding MarR family transcriptional regulator
MIDTAAQDLTEAGAAADGAPLALQTPDSQARDRELRFLWGRIRTLVYDENRRGEVSATLGLSWVKIKALRGLLSGPMAMRDLAHELATDKPYITQIVDALEARGLVTRSVDTRDRRCRIATLTEAGRETALRSEEMLTRPPAALASLSERDLAELIRILAGIPATGDGEPS